MALGYESGRDHQEETAASKQPVLAELVLHTTMAGTLMPQRPHNKGLCLKTFVVRGHSGLVDSIICKAWSLEQETPMLSTIPAGTMTSLSQISITMSERSTLPPMLSLPPQEGFSCSPRHDDFGDSPRDQIIARLEHGGRFDMDEIVSVSYTHLTLPTILRV